MLSSNLHWLFLFLIHSANPQSRPVEIFVFEHVVRTSVLRTFDVSTFQNQARQNTVKTMFATGETVDQGKWIIDFSYFSSAFYELPSSYFLVFHYNNIIGPKQCS